MMSSSIGTADGETAPTSYILLPVREKKARGSAALSLSSARRLTTTFLVSQGSSGPYGTAVRGSRMQLMAGPTADACCTIPVSCGKPATHHSGAVVSSLLKHLLPALHLPADGSILREADEVKICRWA